MSFYVTVGRMCARCERSGANLCSAQFLGAPNRVGRRDYSRTAHGPVSPARENISKITECFDRKSSGHEIIDFGLFPSPGEQGHSLQPTLVATRSSALRRLWEHARRSRCPRRMPIKSGAVAASAANVSDHAERQLPYPARIGARAVLRATMEIRAVGLE